MKKIIFWTFYAAGCGVALPNIFIHAKESSPKIGGYTTHAKDVNGLYLDESGVGATKSNRRIDDQMLFADEHAGRLDYVVACRCYELLCSSEITSGGWQVTTPLSKSIDRECWKRQPIQQHA